VADALIVVIQTLNSATESLSVTIQVLNVETASLAVCFGSIKL